MRSFKKHLFDRVEDHSFRNSGEYLESAIDMAMMFPMLEMAGREECYYLDRVFYFYNTTPHCMHGTRQGAVLQKNNEMIVRGKKPYEMISGCKISVVIPCCNQSSVGGRTLSVIMSSYNQLNSLKYALKSIDKQSVRPLEVIVSDDGSTDGTIEWLDSDHCDFGFDVRYITREHNGYGLATIHNEAVNFARGERILFTNGDVMHSPNSISSHANLDEWIIGGGIIDGIRTSGVGHLTLEMLDDFADIKGLRRKHPSPRNNYSFINGDTTPLGIWGGNFSVSIKKFKEVNGYDIEYDKAYGAEDADLAERIIKSGGRIKWIDQSLGVHIDHDRKVYIQSRIGSKKYYEKRKRR